MEYFFRRAQTLLFKEGLGLGFIAACAVAKVAPIFDDGYYKADAALYMVIVGIGYYFWTYWD